MSTTSHTPRGDFHLSRGMGIWILLASLLINCFLLGLLISPLLRPQGPPPFMHPPHGGMGGPGGIAEHLTRGMSPADAAIVRDTLQSQASLFDESRRNCDKAMQDMTAVLQQPQLDQKQLQEALHNISAAHAKQDEAMAASLTLIAAKLSPEGRQHMAANAPPPHGMGGPGMNEGPGMNMHDMRAPPE